MATKTSRSWFNPLGFDKKDSKKDNSNKKRFKWSWKLFFQISGSALSVIILVTIFLFAWYAKDLPTPGKIKNLQSAQATQIYDRNGQPLYSVFGEQKRISIASDQIPLIVKQATIAIEDKDFYSHNGFYLKGIIRAVINDILVKLHLRTAFIQGSSTITQQYVKNALLSPEQTFDRKIKELILSIEIETMYSKDEILTMYLNEIPYGSNAYGIEAAAQTYFNQPASKLALDQAVTLAAIVQRPSYLSPYGNHTDQLKTRRDLVLDKMADAGYITKDKADETKKISTTYVARRDQVVAPHFVFYIRDQLIQKYGEQMVLEGGLKVTTTLDLKTQQVAEQSLKNAASKLPKYGADNAALVSVEPQTGQILAMVGSIDYFDTAHNGNFNVTTALRQPGSSFKPLVYATAFKGQYSPNSLLWDVTTDFNGYKPSDFDGKNRGPVSIRAALDNSLNIPAVKMLSLVGIDNAVKTAQDMGITSLTEPDKYGLALVLGAAEVKPLEMASAYATFAAQGTYHQPSGILKVEDAKGHVLDEWHDNSRQALDPQVAYEITHVLTDNAARTPIFGAHSPLYFPDRLVAAKTGTTSSFKDGWTLGYTPSIATAVWVGNNNNTPMNKVDGVQTAAPIFHDFITSYYNMNQKPAEDFPRPEGIQEVAVDPMSNKLPTANSPQTVKDIFASWQVPKQQDDMHVAVEVNKLNGKLATDITPPELRETRVYSNVHSERPDNPDWENPVLAWLQAHGIQYGAPPTEKDDYSSSQLPTLSITSPASNAVVTKSFDIVVNPNAPAGIRSVDFSIDNTSIGTRQSAPWSVTYDSTKLSQGNHEIEVTLTDNYGSTVKQTSIFVAAQDQTPPNQITGLTAQSITPGTGIIRLDWINPTDSDFTKVRIYQSTTAGAQGTQVRELAGTPGNAGSVTLTGQTIGTTYYYSITTLDSNGNESRPSTQVSVMAL